MAKTLFAVTAITLALSAGSALGADLPSSKGPVAVPPPPPLWTGFYAGLNAGGTFGGGGGVSVTHLDANPDPAASAALSGVANTDFAGFIGGGQVGYNYQFSPVFVAGLETDIQGVVGNGGSPAFSSVAAGALNSANIYSGNGYVSQSFDYLGTARARVGYLFTPTLLAYATGGLAYGWTNLSHTVFGNVTNGGALVGVSYGNVNTSRTQVGWTVGGGLEWAFAPNWSAKLEYLYYDLGSYNILAETQGVTLNTRASVNSVSLVSGQFHGNIVRVGLNYHFNFDPSAPIVAKP
jgi:outer membrane immunogenic protein